MRTGHIVRLNGIVVAVVSGVLVAGCSGSAATAIDGSDSHDSATGRVPAVHRPVSIECSHTRGPGTADPRVPKVDCSTDADCATGNNGRCLVSTHGGHLNSCSYDECFSDSACGSRVCSCREAPSAPNFCADANCKVDADCGAGGYCSPSVAFDRINVGIAGYWCHTSTDACTDDADCANAKCAYDPGTAHWMCSTGTFFPP